jgi:thiol:disulfide interchange protein DsbG
MMASHTVYVFFDPACPHCARLWSAAQPLLSQLKMVWIPVGFLRNSSTPVGATILSAANPVDAMNANESSVMEGGSGLAPAGSVGEAALGKVKANTQHWQAAGAQSVPFLVYKDPKTGQPTTHEGELDTAGLAALVGL